VIFILFFIDKINFTSLFCHDIDIAKDLFPNEADTASTAVSVTITYTSKTLMLQPVFLM
jgi:hypothetical protein